VVHKETGVTTLIYATNRTPSPCGMATSRQPGPTMASSGIQQNTRVLHCRLVNFAHSWLDSRRRCRHNAPRFAIAPRWPRCRKWSRAPPQLRPSTNAPPANVASIARRRARAVKGRRAPLRRLNMNFIFNIVAAYPGRDKTTVIGSGDCWREAMLISEPFEWRKSPRGFREAGHRCGRPELI